MFKLYRGNKMYNRKNQLLNNFHNNKQVFYYSILSILFHDILISIMENVPSFAELGKNARDVFMTGYHYGKGLIKLNIKTISASKRFEMMSNTILNFESSKVSLCTFLKIIIICILKYLFSTS